MTERRSCLLSVVIPTYNRRELVFRAVDSVLMQDASHHMQVIVVDDGSTDGTGDALKQRYAGDARVELKTAPRRRHASAARNLGFSGARGELICFLDSDDYWLPGILDSVLAVFAKLPHVAFVSVEGSTLATPQRPASSRIVAGDSPGWSHARFRDIPLTSERFELSDKRKSATLLHGDFFPAIIFGDLFFLSGMVIRRDCVERAGLFNERFRYFNDWEFFARLCLGGMGAYLDEDGFRRETGREDQISRQRPATALARRHLFILHSLQRRPDGAARPYDELLQRALDHAHYRMGLCLQASRRVRWARRYLYRCIRHHYKSFRCLLVLAGLHWPI